jgi:hypothetical protein
MRFRVLAVLTLMALLGGALSAAAQTTGEIYGKVVDASQGVMPGVSVTLSGGQLLQPMNATTTESGSYRFPRLDIGSYTLKFELAGFKTIIKEGIRLEIGMNVQVNQVLEISTLQETVTVSGETPLVDLKDTGKGSRFTQEVLQSIPSARDPWVIIEQAAGVAMDRQNVGGSASGQQSNFVARGAAMSQQKWNLDGVDITDMSATGGSPVYYDFDSFEEMQISTGGADVTMQTPGVGVNLVTKSGSDKFRGSGRVYITDEKYQSNNATEELRKQGLATGNPIQNIKDFGGEVGGPIMKGRLWLWGSYGKQNVKVGVNGFYKADAECQAMKAAPINYSIEDLRGCLNTDLTTLNNYNLKLSAQPFRNNQFSFLFNGAEKVRNARDASDTRPLETTYRQGGVLPESGFGSRWWKTGMPKTYKWSDRHVLSDRLMVELQYSHVGNNFVLDFHEPSLADVQATYDSLTGMYGRSYLAQTYVRPTDSIDLTGNYFLPGVFGGDHAIKFGLKYRNDEAISLTHYGGNTWAVYRGGAPYQAWLYRDGYTDYKLYNRNVYVQDSFTRKRMTINAGVRYDYQTDEALGATVGAHPFYGKTSADGYTFNQLPGITFDGAKAGLSFGNFSPRIGVTYDLTGNGSSVVKASYALYVGQLGTGSLSSVYNPVKVIETDYPWADANNDGYVQANEITIGAGGLGYAYITSGYNPSNPSALTTTTKLDSNLKSERIQEVVLTFDKQLFRDFAVSASYIWRKYDNFRATWRDNWSSANYTQATYTPTTCGTNNGRCPTVTYYVPTSTMPVTFTVRNQDGYWRGYQGFEFSARKRMSKNWMMSTSYSFNDAPVHYDGTDSYQDPTNIEQTNGSQYAEQSTSSGLDNVFVNARWIYRLSAAYTVPWQKIGIAATFNSRSGYPFEATVLTPSRPFAAGTANVLLDKIGDVRLPSFKQLDMKIDKPVTLFKRVRMSVSLDVFNVTNGNTVLAKRRTQNATNANNIANILAPRVLRFGTRITW